MEFLSSFANINNFTMIVLLAAVVLLAIGVGKGSIKFKGKSLSVGRTEQETRDLIQSQMDYAAAKCEGVISQLPEGLDVIHAKYIICRVEQAVNKAIIFNNLTRDEAYIKAKQELIYQTIMKRITNDYFKTPDFKAFVYKFVDELFTELWRMKQC